MLNTCGICQHVIDDDEDVELYIMGKYKQVAATNIFALHKEVRYKMDTLVHAKCAEEEEEAYG